MQETVDSDQGITGHKLAYLRSFQPGETYEFILNVDPAFTDFRSSRKKPIEVFLVDTNLILSSLSAVTAAVGNNPYNFPEFIPDMIGYAKSGGWIVNLPPTGGEFSITPGNSQSCLLFCAFTEDSPETCVITSFDRATNTFTLGGY